MKGVNGAFAWSTDIGPMETPMPAGIEFITAGRPSGGEVHVIAGAPRIDATRDAENVESSSSGGCIVALSTRAGEPIWAAQAFPPGSGAGRSILAIPDRNGDGFEDLVVGAPHREAVRQGGKRVPNVGCIFGLSGADGSVITECGYPNWSGPNVINHAYQDTRFGTDIALLSETPGKDCKIVVGAPGGFWGGAPTGLTAVLTVHSGTGFGITTGCRVGRDEANIPTHGFGSSVAVIDTKWHMDPRLIVVGIPDIGRSNGAIELHSAVMESAVLRQLY